jgi:hypothetical protein
MQQPEMEKAPVFVFPSPGTDRSPPTRREAVPCSPSSLRIALFLVLRMFDSTVTPNTRHEASLPAGDPIRTPFKVLTLSIRAADSAPCSCVGKSPAYRRPPSRLGMVVVVNRQPTPPSLIGQARSPHSQQRVAGSSLSKYLGPRATITEA